VRDALGSRGFEHYEVSNYARSGAFAEHNLGYWQGGDYLGLGCGAWGTVRHNGQRIRYRNTPVPERYTSSAGAWKATDPLTVGPLVEQVEPLDGETSMRERLMLGLRLASGVNVEGAAAALGVEPWPASRQRAVERLIARRRLERDGGRLRIPPEAWLFADGTIAELM
jgi:oxygen-independent coproporphyrinogen-3 oxidase